MIYDTLYALDESCIPHPQMVATREVSDDRLTYELTLRPGLSFNTGQKVTTEDVIASIPRAAKQDPLMQVMMKRQTGMEAVDATLPHPFPKPFPYRRLALGAYNSRPARRGHRLRRRRAPAHHHRFRPVPVRHGPQFISGAKVVYEKNP